MLKVACTDMHLTVAAKQSLLTVETEEETASEVITLEVACPDDGVAGDVLSVHIGHENEGEESTTVDVEIPEGVQPGETFEVHVAR